MGVAILVSNDVIAEDKLDTEKREDILLGLFARNSGSQSLFTESFGEPARTTALSDTENRYVSRIINPPMLPSRMT